MIRFQRGYSAEHSPIFEKEASVLIRFQRGYSAELSKETLDETEVLIRFQRGYSAERRGKINELRLVLIRFQRGYSAELKVSGALTPPFAGEVEGMMFQAWRAWTYDDFRAYA